MEELSNGKHQTIDAWDIVLKARSEKRFKSLDIIKGVFEDFFELHGDRCFGDDKSIIGGLAYLDGSPVTIISQQKGYDIQDKIERNYGMTYPEGYKKSLRLMKQAEKFNRPIICLVDTPGAYAGIEAEKRGQALCIGQNLYEMSLFHVPIISIIVGEGGSGGALGLTLANKIFMLENSIFSVVSPEGCASILWKDCSLAPKAAKLLKLTSDDTLKLGIIDKIIYENVEFKVLCDNIKNLLIKTLKEYKEMSPEEIYDDRNKKIRNIGIV